MTKGIIGEVD